MARAKKKEKVEDEITPEMLEELSNGKGEDEDGVQQQSPDLIHTAES